jgi:hypothetical protein
MQCDRAYLFLRQEFLRDFMRDRARNSAKWHHFNIARRHLSDEQRADIAAKLATRLADRPTKMVQNAPLKTQEGADPLNVSVDQVKRAKARQAGKPTTKPEPKLSAGSALDVYDANEQQHAELVEACKRLYPNLTDEEIEKFLRRTGPVAAPD